MLMGQTEFGVSHMKQLTLPVKCQKFRLVGVGPLIPVDGCMGSSAHLSIVANQVYSFMAPSLPMAEGIIYRDNAPSHKGHIDMN